MLDVHRLKIFVRVAELRSFSKAAQASYLTQPTVSQHIQALEDFLGLALFDRLGREVCLTRAGEILFGFARQITHLAEETLQTLEHFKGNKTGSLVIGASTIPGEYMLPHLLGEFVRSYPGVTTVLRIADTRQTIDDLAARTIDVGLVGAKINHACIQFTRLADDEQIVVVPRGHRWCQEPVIDLQELCREPFVIRESGSGSRMALGKKLHSAGITTDSLTIAAELGSTTAIKQAVKAGVGVALISERAVDEELAAGILRKVPVSGMSFIRSFYLVQDRRRTPSPLCKTFVQFLKKTVSTHTSGT
jgi:DNA-binding transcriptional LysR family regulator